MQVHVYETLLNVLVPVTWAALAFGVYQRWAFSRELKTALQSGSIPSDILRPRMGIFWLFNNVNALPTGRRRLRMSLAAWSVWLVCVAALMVISIEFRPPRHCEPQKFIGTTVWRCQT